MLLLDLLEKYSGYNHKRWTSQSESAFSQDPFFQTIALFRFILIAKLVRLVACEGDHAMRAVVSCYKYHLDLKRDTSILEVFVRVPTIKATWKVLTSRRAEKWTRLFDVFRCNLQAPSLDWQIQAIKQSHESVHLRAFHRDVFFGAAFGQTANKKNDDCTRLPSVFCLLNRSRCDRRAKKNEVGMSIVSRLFQCVKLSPWSEKWSLKIDASMARVVQELVYMRFHSTCACNEHNSLHTV